MSRITFLALIFGILCFSVNVNAAIYQYKDAAGNIVFTDKPVTGSKKIKENQPSVVPAPHTHKKENKGRDFSNPSFGPVTILEKKKVAKPYKAMSINSPQDDEAIRSNNGSLTIQVTLKPKLQTKFGHKIKIYLDGKRLKETWKTQTVKLLSLDRGTHTLSAVVVDKKGKKLKQTKTTKFHLLRFSRIGGR